MFRRSIVVIGLLLIAVGGDAQTFLKVIGDPGRAEVGHVALVTASGQIYIGGAANDSALVIRLDGNGTVLWSRTFKPAGNLPKLVLQMVEAPDGSIIGCGSGMVAGEVGGEGFHFRMDDGGNMQWVRNWVEPGPFARRLVWNNENEYVLFGGVEGVGSTTSLDLFNAQIDAFNGDAILMPDIIDLNDIQPYADQLRGVASLDVYHFAVSAFSMNGGTPSGQRIGLSVFDMSGYHQDSKYLIFPDNVDRRVEPSDIVANDDSLTIAYYGDINGSSTNSSVGLIRCDMSGNVAWARDFNLGGSSQEQSTRVVPTPFGYVLGGITKSTSPQRLFLMAISRSGQFLWSKSYGSATQSQSLLEDMGYNVDFTGDGFILTGFVDLGGGERDLLLIRTDIDGEIVCDEVQDRNAITTVLPQFNYPLGATATPNWSDQGQAQPQVVNGGIADQCEVEVDLGPDTSSCAAQITLDAGVIGATYEWQDGSTGQTLEVNGSGTYWVRVSLGCCIGSDTIVVSAGEIPGIYLGADTAICEEAELLLHTITGTWTYEWSDGSTDPSLTVTAEGTYWVEVVDGDCMAQDTIVVSLSELPTVVLGPDTLSCDGSSIQLIPVEVTGADSYLWTGGSNGPTLVVAASGTITLEVENSCGTASDEQEVEVFDLGLDLGVDTTICEGATLTLQVDLPAWTLTWSDGSDGNTFVISEAGEYWLDAERSGCMVSDTIAVEELSLPTVTLPADATLCAGASVAVEPVMADVDEFVWSDGSDHPTLIVTQEGNYHIDVSNQCGTASDTIFVDFIEPLAVDLGPDTTLCGTDTLILDLSSNGASVVWRNGSTDPVFIVTGPAHYWVEAVIGTCMDRDTVDVDYTDLAPLDLGVDRTLCTVPSLTLDAGSQGDAAVWQDGTVGRTYVAESTGRYIATITNYCGPNSDTVQVNFAVPVEPLSDLEICAVQQVTLDPVGDLVEVRWTTGDTADAITVGEGDYGYEATDIYGCLHADFVTINWLEESDGQVMIPTAFTPNGDGHNEEFMVYGAEAGAFQLVLFDRWGEEIYRANDPLDFWDGKSGGRAVPDGVYMYTITYQDRCNAGNTLITERGHVTVLR